MIFLGFYLKKILVQEDFPETINQLKDHDLQIIVSSNTSLYLAISAATRVNIVDPEKSILIGRNIILNNVETI